MRLLGELLDLLYPPRCAICREGLGEDRARTPCGRSLPFCRTCFEGFKALPHPVCTVCGRPFVSDRGTDHPCEACLRKRPHFDRAGAPYCYEGPLMKALHRFKYSGKSGLSEALGPLLAAFAQGWVQDAKDPLVMPVPLHPRRLRQRGYNQSLLLARHVAPALGAELDYLSLRRVRHTPPQTGLTAEERRRNVRKAFEVRATRPAPERTVILVDDVATTGNTLNECARVLKRQGFETVLCLVMARTRTG